MAESPNSPPGSLSYPYSLNFQSSTSVAIIIVVLGATFFFMFLFVIYIRRCNTERIEGGPEAVVQGWSRQQMIHGLDPEILQKFPIMQFSSVIKGSSGNNKDLECAVCLGAFEESELLRLLPACGHLFHPDCIDMWLHTHSTCPLCRRSLSRDAVSGHLQRALAALTGSLRNPSPSASPEDTHVENPDLERGPQPVSPPAAPESDNSNSTGHILRTLSRNSESFKAAAHSMEVQDVRERLALRSGSTRCGSPSLARMRSLHNNQASPAPSPAASASNPMTPIACGVMQHSQSFSELSRQMPPLSPLVIGSSNQAAAAAGTTPAFSSSSSSDGINDGNAADSSPSSSFSVHSERWRNAPRALSLSSLRRSFSASSSSSRYGKGLANVSQLKS